MADSTIRITITTEAEQTLAALNDIRSQIGQLAQSFGSVTGASAAATAGLSSTAAAAASAGAAMAEISAGANAAAAGENTATAGAEALGDALSDTAEAGNRIDGDGMDDVADAAARAESNLDAAGGGVKQVAAQRGRIAALAAAIASAAAAGGKWAAVTEVRGLQRAAAAAARGLRALGADIAKISILGGRWLASRGMQALKASALAATAALSAGAAALMIFGVRQEQTRLRLEVMLGSVEKANALLGQLQKFANVTPFNTAEVVSAGQTLLGFGVSAGDVISRIKNLGDISAGTGKDLNELAAIYGKVFAKGKAETEQLNQLTEAGVPIIRALADMYGVSGEAVYEMAARGRISAADLQAALESLTTEGGIFGGMMEKQSRTVGGLWSTLIGNLQTIAGTVGEQLAPLAREILNYLVGWSDRINELARNGSLVEWVGGFAVTAVTALTEIAKWIVTVVNHAGAAVKTIRGWVDMLWGGIQTGFWSLVAFVSDGITAIINGILRAYNWVITKFGGTEVGLLEKQSDGMWERAGEAYNETTEAAGRALDGRYFSEAMADNAEFDQAANAFAQRINDAVSRTVDRAKNEAGGTGDDAVLTAGGMQEDKRSPAPVVNQSRAASDALTKIGGYRFGLNSVTSSDRERNKLLEQILGSVKKIKVESSEVLV